MSPSYEGRQIVGIDLHRRRSVIVRMTPDGYPLGTVRISNDAATLAAEISRAGEHPDVVLEATYGWYWAADVLAAAGAQVHLAHPLGVKGFAYRRVKNDVRDAADLADLLRMGRLPEAWVAPPPVRELRETVRHRAALVAIRSACKAQIHAVLAKNGVAVPMTDLFGQAGTDLLGQVELPSPFHARVTSLRRLIDLLDFEIDAAACQLAGRLARDPGYQALLVLPGVGKTLAAVFLAEIGDITRFPTPGHLASWAGLTPRHRESDTTVHRGHITKQGSSLIRWAAIEAVSILPPTTPVLGPTKTRVAARRGTNIGKVAAARKLLTFVFYALRDGEVRALHTAA
ncbi:transposase IS116/IS110/IS902 family protein [Parafrankia sp. EAN1pec]|uniref:IS110 family transposase n=1 Tax=Parafrankia sp. (strain EAN1pec) TaxID=298653 RepID=UPI0000541C47|nr:transposase IS116/IS110/IS902 family protein [Frankia sp. EAN1pec]ABW12512.1 transposase IS116/IS110/IS902 family protein [Frankia sp. EAN1pec]